MDFQQMTLSQLEEERIRLIGEINLIDAQTREMNGEKPRIVRQEIQNIIERLVVNLLPNLFAPTLNSLKETFPDEQQLTEITPEKPLPPSNMLWDAIKKLFGSGEDAPDQNLERQRVLLRNVLWNLSALPSYYGKYQYLFLHLQQKKQELLAAEKNLDKVEFDADELFVRHRKTVELLKECEREIARRARRSDVRDSSSELPNYRPPDDAPIFYSNPTSRDDYSSGSSAAESQSSGEDFSFGGGGDFAGGGAGGSWDNYS